MIDNTPSRTTHITTNHGLDGPHQRCHILKRKARRMIAMRRARHDRCTWEKQHTQVVAAYKRASGVSEARKQRNETATTLPHVFCTSPARSLPVLKIHILPSTVLAQHRQQLGHTPCYCTPLPAPARVNLGAGSDTTVTPTMATPTWQGILAVRWRLRCVAKYTPRVPLLAHTMPTSRHACNRSVRTNVFMWSAGNFGFNQRS